MLQAILVVLVIRPFTPDNEYRRLTNQSATLVYLQLCLTTFYDPLFFRKLLGYESLDEMYSKMSCINYWHGIDKPMVFINAVDDPIVPPQLLEKVKACTS